MLKTLVDRIRSKPAEPTVWHGRHSDIWPDPGAADHGWYCGWCGHNQSQYRTDPDAKNAAQDHALTHREIAVAVAEWN